MTQSAYPAAQNESLNCLPVLPEEPSVLSLRLLTPRSQHIKLENLLSDSEDRDTNEHLQTLEHCYPQTQQQVLLHPLCEF